MTTPASSSTGDSLDTWQQLGDLEDKIKVLRKQLDDAKSTSDKHRKVQEETLSQMETASEDEKPSMKKTMKDAKEAWLKAEALYKTTVKELTTVELKKQALMEKVGRQLHERQSLEEVVKNLSEQMATLAQRSGEDRTGRTDGDALVELVTAIKGTDTTGGRGATTRTRSLANLPMLSKAENFLEHRTKLETYFRINDVTKDSDKKDVLMLSLTAEVANRTQGIDACEEPFTGQTWRQFAESVRSRMIPKASAAILRTQFESMKQSATEYAIDYLVRKNALFLKAFPGDDRRERAMPVSYLVRHLVDGLYQEDLKAEIWREIRGTIDENDSRDLDSINEAFSELLQATNLTLDFVRRNLNVKEDTDKRGLSVVSQTNSKSETPTPIRTSTAQYVNAAMEGGENDETDRWVEEEEEGGFPADQGEEGDDLEAPLSEEIISYCELVEGEEQSRFWNGEEVGETSGGGGGEGPRGACWICGSLAHFKRACPQRLRAVNNRVNALTQRSWRGRGGMNRGGSTRGRPGARRGAPSFSAYRPFGRGAGGGGRFYPSGGQPPTWYPSAPSQGGSGRGDRDRKYHPF